MPALFFVDSVMPAVGAGKPISAMPNVAAYWAAMQTNEHAARVLIELRRGLEERREMIRSGAIDQFIAARSAAEQAAAAAKPAAASTQ